jgi:hypothetical protein
MSTKTSIKRIALVAVSALGFGLLSVVPAKAAASEYTMALGTITPADGSAVVGATVTIPVTLDTAADPDATDSVTFTAVFAQKPINTALVDTSISAGVTTLSTTLATEGHTTTASSNTLTYASAAASDDIGGAAAAGEFTFVPDTAGVYKITIDEGATATVAATTTAVTAITIIVGGAALTQSASGKGATTGSAVVGGSAVAVYHVPGATADNTVYNITSSGVGSISNPGVCDTDDATLEGTDTAVRCATVGGGGGASGVATTINGTNYSDGAKFTFDAGPAAGNVLVANYVGGSFTVDASSSVAGAQTITITSINQATGVPTTRATITINWVASASGAASAQHSTAWIVAGATAATSTTDATADGVNCSKAVVAGACANVVVTVKDANAVALLNAPLSASISGPGVLGVIDEDGDTSAWAKSGRAVATSATTGHLDVNVGSFAIYADGTSGLATITISSGTTVLATKYVNFYGTVSKLNVTQNLKVARAGALGYELGCDAADCGWLGTAVSTPAVYIEAVDAEGNVVPGLTIGYVTSDASVILSASVTQDDATAGDGPGYYNASVTSAPNGVSGKTATVTFRTLLSTGAYVTADPVTFSLGGTVATATLTLDKASYQVGEAMVVTRTAKDSAGNPVYDGVASPAVVFSKAIGGTAPAAGEYRSGVSASSATRPTVFAPSTGGAFEARATFSFAGVSTQVTATATVADDASTAAAAAAADAAAEAIDAANAATDAANLAAEAADAATVAAEEARDAADAATAAVEELATQVATLMAALKAQITTLANTVAKIAKKVKA